MEAKGGITGILGSWVQLLVEDREVDPPNHRLRQSALVETQVQAIKAQLSWLVEQDFAAEFVTEVSEIRWQMRALLGESEREWIPVGWDCAVIDPEGDGTPCGTPLRQKRDQWHIRCRGCGSKWTGEAEFERLGRMLGCEYEVTIDQAVRLSNVSRTTIVGWITAGRLPVLSGDGYGRVVDTRDVALLVAQMARHAG
jgi:hypothetical protein